MMVKCSFKENNRKKQMLHIIQTSKDACLEKLSVFHFVLFQDMLLLVVNCIYSNISHYKLNSKGPEEGCYDDWSLDSLVAKKVFFYIIEDNLVKLLVLFLNML